MEREKPVFGMKGRSLCLEREKPVFGKGEACVWYEREKPVFGMKGRSVCLVTSRTVEAHVSLKVRRVPYFCHINFLHFK